MKSLDDDEQALPIRREVYSVTLQLYGEEHVHDPHRRQQLTRRPY